MEEECYFSDDKELYNYLNQVLNPKLEVLLVSNNWENLDLVGLVNVNQSCYFNSLF